MQLVKLTTTEKTKALYCFRLVFFISFSCIFFNADAQDNSPYSRYGVGDIVPSTHVAGRGMGGLSAGISDPFGLTINFNNPASYANFQTVRELKSKKLASGRAILDIGLNFENRTLKEPGNPEKFTASNALFSYMQIGMPLTRNWGLSFGLRPISRISYKIFKTELLHDPLSSAPIDTAVTRYEGEGGSYIGSIGTGFKIKNFSIGANVGWLFGKKDYKTKRTFLNDTVAYYQANFETASTFGDLYFDIGAQYKIELNKKVVLTLGAYGNIRHTLNATKDIIRETFTFDANQGEVRLDSVSDQKNIKGNLIYPSSYTFGFALQKLPEVKEGGWLFGIDFTQQNWNQYRFYNQADSVQNKWELRIGTELRPVPGRTLFSNVTYRAGFFIGPDYIRINKKLSRFGASFGMGIPMKLSRQALNQATIINLALEYGKRGNNNNVLRENTFRFSVGFSLSDFWFIKRKYD